MNELGEKYSERNSVIVNIDRNALPMNILRDCTCTKLYADNSGDLKGAGLHIISPSGSQMLARRALRVITNCPAMSRDKTQVYHLKNQIQLYLLSHRQSSIRLGFCPFDRAQGRFYARFRSILDDRIFHEAILNDILR